MEIVQIEIDRKIMAGSMFYKKNIISTVYLPDKIEVNYIMLFCQCFIDIF